MYQAPELYSADHAHGVASESFSLGVVLFELATGFRPYNADRLASLEHLNHDEIGFWHAADALQDNDDIRSGN
jgi:serine/threonine protein kinase